MWPSPIIKRKQSVTMVKIKELRNFRLKIVTFQNVEKGFKAIFKQFKVPVPKVQSIIMNLNPHHGKHQ